VSFLDDSASFFKVRKPVMEVVLGLIALVTVGLSIVVLVLWRKLKASSSSYNELHNVQ